MKLVQIYQCLCDETRLRIINLLLQGPLCVCHIQDILEESQVHVSRHLSYLKKRGMAEATRHRNWMIYHLPAKPSPELEANLKCLQDCRITEKIFREDLKRLKKISASENVKQVIAAGCCS